MIERGLGQVKRYVVTERSLVRLVLQIGWPHSCRLKQVLLLLLAGLQKEVDEHKEIRRLKQGTESSKVVVSMRCKRCVSLQSSLSTDKSETFSPLSY